jgi:hypothetical protein
MYKIGFTGTQRGMNPFQKAPFEKILQKIVVKSKGLIQNEFHHGDCIGADNDAHQIAATHNYFIVLHPPTNPSKRAFNIGAHKIMEKHDYLVRNRHIVDSTDILIATPGEMTEQLRSGTWSTIRYARKRNKKVIILYPELSK